MSWSANTRLARKRLLFWGSSVTGVSIAMWVYWNSESAFWGLATASFVLPDNVIWNRGIVIAHPAVRTAAFFMTVTAMTWPLLLRRSWRVCGVAALIACLPVIACYTSVDCVAGEIYRKSFDLPGMALYIVVACVLRQIAEARYGPELVDVRQDLLLGFVLGLMWLAPFPGVGFVLEGFLPFRPIFTMMIGAAVI